MMKKPGGFKGMLNYDGDLDASDMPVSKRRAEFKIAGTPEFLKFRLQHRGIAEISQPGK